MKSRLAAFAASIIALIGGLTLTASAEAFSTSYCDTGLYGQGTAAPDNDVRRQWDRIQNGYGINLYQTAIQERNWWPGEVGISLAVRIRFYGIYNGANWYGDTTFACFDWDPGPGLDFHDGRYPTLD